MHLSGCALLRNGLSAKVGKTGDYVRILQGALQRLVQLIQCVFRRARGCVQAVPYADFEILETGFTCSGTLGSDFSRVGVVTAKALIWPDAICGVVLVV